MPDIEQEPRPRKLTREEVRQALACPVCHTPGAFLGEKCRKCGSYQDKDGRWVTPSETEKKSDKNQWFDW